MIFCEMKRLIFGGAVVISLAMMAYAAPQYSQSSGQQQQSQIVTNNGSPTDKPSAYKNNTRDSPTGESELFGFPEDPSNIESKQNARNRTPVFIPNRCQQNEILYPGDQESDWVCDCKPTFVYHPPTRQCYQLFTQGYCEGETMIILKKDAKHPECVVNNCHKPNATYVEFEGDCVQLNEYHAKCLHHKLKQLVGVREDTHELGCVNISDVQGKYLNPSNSVMNTTRPRSS